MKQKNRGQSLVEYVALTALVAIVSIGTVKVFGGKIRSRLNQITNTFDRNVQQGLKSRPARGSRGSDDEGDEDEGIRIPNSIKIPDIFKLPKGLPPIGIPR